MFSAAFAKTHMNFADWSQIFSLIGVFMLMVVVVFKMIYNHFFKFKGKYGKIEIVTQLSQINLVLLLFFLGILGIWWVGYNGFAFMPQSAQWFVSVPITIFGFLGCLFLVIDFILIYREISAMQKKFVKQSKCQMFKIVMGSLVYGYLQFLPVAKNKDKESLYLKQISLAGVIWIFFVCVSVVLTGAFLIGATAHASWVADFVVGNWFIFIIKIVSCSILFLISLCNIFNIRKATALTLTEKAIIIMEQITFLPVWTSIILVSFVALPSVFPFASQTA